MVSRTAAATYHQRPLLANNGVYSKVIVAFDMRGGGGGGVILSSPTQRAWNRQQQLVT